MADAAALAATLGEEHEALITEWERRVRALLPAAKRYDRVALRDSMPDIVARVAEAIAHGNEQANRHYRDLSRQHARERAEDGEYTLEQLICEYHVVEQVLLDALERDQLLERGPRDALRSAIHSCIAEAASEFAAEQVRDLSRDRELYGHLVEGVRDYAIFAVDPDGLVTSWNRGAQRMKGYTAEEIIGQHFAVFYPEDARQRNEPMEHLRMAASRGRYRGEGYRVKKGGEPFLADVLITPMYVRGTLQGYSKVVADLTERSKIVQERELSRAHVAGIQAEQRAREEFISKMSHDLRSPLQAAKMGAELLRRRIGDPEAVDRLMLRVSGNLARLDEMVQQLLDLNRLRAGETPHIERVECVMNEVVREALDELATIYGDRFVMTANTQIEGEWDPNAIRRIVENLCTNAVKYGARGRPITLTLTKTAREAQIAVHNDGDPIPPEARERLFNHFSRASGPKSSQARGWGIGLAVVKELVEAHGGTVRVDSVESAGTTFKIDLPLRPDAPRASMPE